MDDIGEKGTHWVAARWCHGRLYYADPFGTILNGWPPEELAQFKPQTINRIAWQRPESHLCGYYAALFAKAMDNIKRFTTIGEFENLLWDAIK